MSNRHGFTIVELLIVIVIIAILAAITIVAFNGIQTRAKVSSFSQVITSTTKAFKLYAVETGWSQWPLDSTITPSPTMPNLIANWPGFSNYLQQVNQIAGVHPNSWGYDQDDDTLAKGDCSYAYNGTNIMIANITSEIAAGVDTQLDDGNTGCGTIRYDSGVSRLIVTVSKSNKPNDT